MCLITGFFNFGGVLPASFLGMFSDLLRESEMRGRFQWRASVIVAASRDRVWAVVDDISLIPSYHPEVRKVDLLSGHRTRAIGARYRCTVPDGRKGSCVEEVVGYVPGERVATAFPVMSSSSVSFGTRNETFLMK